MEKDAKKEAFRKYLESSGVLDALTKVLVALYEENDKPSSALDHGAIAQAAADPVQMPDNDDRRQAEDQIKRLLKDPRTILALVQHMRTAKTSNVRHLAAVLIRKKITGRWPKLSVPVKASLIESITLEQRFVQQKLGGPSISDYEKLQAEKADLQLKYDELLRAHKEACRQLEELKNSKVEAEDGVDVKGDL